MSTMSLFQTLTSEFDTNSTIEQILDTDDILSLLSQFKHSQKFFQYFDTTRIKQLIDYALVPHNSNEQGNVQINIEKLNISQLPMQIYLKSNNTLNLFNKAYKFPYLSSEILSHDLPFIVDKFIPRENAAINFSTYQDNILCETSMTNTSDINLLEDEVLDEQNPPKNSLMFNPPEIEYNTDKDTSLNNSLDRRLLQFNSIDVNLNANYDLIDYIFSVFASHLNEMNSINGGYFFKIIQSLIHSQIGNRSLLFMKYICFKKKEMIKSFMSNIQNEYYQKIILEILLFEFGTNEEDNNAGDALKLNLLIYLIGLFSFEKIWGFEDEFYEQISNLLCDYMDSSKNFCELLLNESFLNILVSDFASMKSNSKMFEYLCVFCCTLIKEYKEEYDHSKFLISLSKSHKNLTSEKNDKTILVLNLEIDNILCMKLSACIESFPIFSFESKDSSHILPILHSMEFIRELIQITRNCLLLENLNKNDFFMKASEYFFIIFNDVYQNIFISIIKTIVEEYNEQWLICSLLTSKFLDKCISNSPLKKNLKFLFPHIAVILEMLLINQNTVNFLVKNNLHEILALVYKNCYSECIDKMNKPLANFRNTFLYMSSIKNESNDNMEVDEIDFENHKVNPKISNLNNVLEEERSDIEEEKVEEGNETGLILGKIENEEENENFYYDNNYWQPTYKVTSFSNGETKM